MSDENKPSNTNTGTVGAASTVGSQDVQNLSGGSQNTSTSAGDLTKADIEATLGRKFATKEEAIKTLQGLNSLVGDQAIARYRADSENYSKVKSQVAAQYGWTPEYTDLYLQGKVPGAAAPEVNKTSMDETKDPVARNEVAQLKAQLQQEQLTKKYPDAEAIIDVIKAVSQTKGISLLEAYETSGLKDMGAASKPSPSTVASPTGRVTVGSGNEDLAKLAEYRKSVLTGKTNEQPYVDVLKNRLGLQ